ncbi:peptidase M14 [Aquimarina sp. U1-2]|uniref:M14 family zinc carboxypeptidase n=1 Tax=Aquimarina sp. U1-2 TaxID=2823141 RepID=UPI001AEC8FF2|nr:M14 family zinc carboxypeptidase [Aquimarina sp. U1-2]MBP2831959.1 peptidase M14 [Aquimarina sp. U1-2]
MNIDVLKNWFATYSESSLRGRYIHYGHIAPLFDNLSEKVDVKHIGLSENNLPIHLLKIGSGPKKLLLWSQMHGNESTTTKALFDLINVLIDPHLKEALDILKGSTLYIVPILNPDGAKVYSRLNYNSVDLNRDAQHRTQSESKILDTLIKDVRPDFAFNLHGQRTIFGTGVQNKSATVSFLSPAGDAERSITTSRKMAMEVIAHMNNVLQLCIPNQVGRYDDGFNINCVGDTLTSKEIPTLLFEAGHYPNDYEREVTRKYIFYALVSAIHYISTTSVTGNQFQDYFTIPENKKCLYDIIIRDVILKNENVDIAVQYTEELMENAIRFIPKIVKIGDLQNFYGHKEIEGKKRQIRHEIVTVEIVPEINLLKFYLDSELFSIELAKR